MNRLKELRKSIGLRQEDIAKRLNITIKTYRSWEIGNPNGSFPAINSNMLVELSKIFNVSIDYMLGLSDYTTDYNNLVGEKTGLTNDAISTLIKLNDGKFYIKQKYRYALHTINLLLADYENVNLFELIYHFLCGSYNIFGHYDDIGKIVYDGSQIFISDEYKTNAMEINTTLVNEAILHTINKTLEKWKNDISRDRLSVKLIPSEETLKQKIDVVYEQAKNKIEYYRELQTEYESFKDNKIINYEGLEDIWQRIYIVKDCIKHQSEEINNLNYSLKKIYHSEYYRIEIESEIREILQ